MSDEQIAALVAAAQALSRRHRSRHPDAGPGEVDERLLRLDWAVRAGQAVLAERAARALVPPGSPPRVPSSRSPAGETAG